jgi:hypothetical protein
MSSRTAGFYTRSLKYSPAIMDDYVCKTGDTMGGTLDMNGYNLTNVGNITYTSPEATFDDDDLSVNTLYVHTHALFNQDASINGELQIGTGTMFLDTSGIRTTNGFRVSTANASISINDASGIVLHTINGDELIFTPSGEFTVKGDLVVEGDITTAGGGAINFDTSQLDASISALDASMVAAFVELTLHDASLGVLAAGVFSLDTSMGIALARLDGLDASFVVATAAIAQLDASMSAAEGRLDGLDVSVSAAEGRLDNLDVSVSAAEGRLDGLDVSVSAAEDRLDNLDVSVSAAEGRLDDLDVSVSAAEGRLDNLDISVSAAEVRLDGLDVSVSAAEGRLDGLDVSVSTAEGRLDAHDVSLAALDASAAFTAGWIDDSSNYIQDLSLNGRTLTITGGAGSVQIPNQSTDELTLLNRTPFSTSLPRIPYNSWTTTNTLSVPFEENGLYDLDVFVAFPYCGTWIRAYDQTKYICLSLVVPMADGSDLRYVYMFNKNRFQYSATDVPRPSHPSAAGTFGLNVAGFEAPPGCSTSVAPYVQWTTMLAGSSLPVTRTHLQAKKTGHDASGVYQSARLTSLENGVITQRTGVDEQLIYGNTWSSVIQQDGTVAANKVLLGNGDEPDDYLSTAELNAQHGLPYTTFSFSDGERRDVYPLNHDFLSDVIQDASENSIDASGAVSLLNHTLTGWETTDPSQAELTSLVVTAAGTDHSVAMGHDADTSAVGGVSQYITFDPSLAYDMKFDYRKDATDLSRVDVAGMQITLRDVDGDYADQSYALTYGTLQPDEVSFNDLFKTISLPFDPRDKAFYLFRLLHAADGNPRQLFVKNVRFTEKTTGLPTLSLYNSAGFSGLIGDADLPIGEYPDISGLSAFGTGVTSLTISGEGTLVGYSEPNYGGYSVVVDVSQQDWDGDASWNNALLSFKFRIRDYVEVLDRDGDGFEDAVDAFPDDPTEWLDTDGDGVGDNADALTGPYNLRWYYGTNNLGGNVISSFSEYNASRFSESASEFYTMDQTDEIDTGVHIMLYGDRAQGHIVTAAVYTETPDTSYDITSFWTDAGTKPSTGSTYDALRISSVLFRSNNNRIKLQWGNPYPYMGSPPTAPGTGVSSHNFRVDVPQTIQLQNNSGTMTLQMARNDDFNVVMLDPLRLGLSTPSATTISQGFSRITRSSGNVSSISSGSVSSGYTLATETGGGQYVYVYGDRSKGIVSWIGWRSLGLTPASPLDINLSSWLQDGALLDSSVTLAANGLASSGARVNLNEANGVEIRNEFPFMRQTAAFIAANSGLPHSIGQVYRSDNSISSPALATTVLPDQTTLRVAANPGTDSSVSAEGFFQIYLNPAVAGPPNLS